MKKIVSIILASVIMVVLLSSCANTSYIATIGNEKLPVGPYAFYAYYTRDNYQTNLSYYGVTDFTSALTEQADSNGTKLYAYIISATKESYTQHILTERKFDEYGLSLTDEQKESLDTAYKETWEDGYGIEKFSEILKTLNMTTSEFKEMLSVTYKSTQLTDYLFGDGGMYEITEEELKNNYSENYERFRYIAVSKVDSDGNTLTTDELIAKKAIVDEAYQKAVSGEDFGELVAEYSEDYLAVTDDMTDEQKTYYEQQNQQSREDGLVTDSNGIFNSTYYYYYSYTIDSTIVNKLFSMSEGDIELVELSSSFWIIQKCDKNEKEDYFESKRSDIYSSIADPILEELYEEWENELLITFNDAAVNKYDPRKIDSLFTTTSSDS